MATEIVAIAYKNKKAADKAAAYLRRQDEDNQVALEEVAVVTVGDEGQVVADISDVEPSKKIGGASAGALIGAIVGAFVGPAGAVAGFAIGGGIGAHEAGQEAIDDDFFSAVGDEIADGGYAVIVAAKEEELSWLSGHVPKELRGKLVRTTLSDERVHEIRSRGMAKDRGA
jgi:uncharacterized membrane protein